MGGKVGPNALACRVPILHPVVISWERNASVAAQPKGTDLPKTQTKKEEPWWKANQVDGTSPAISKYSTTTAKDSKGEEGFR